MSTSTEVRFTRSDSLPDVLAAAGCSVLISTYQAGQLVSLGLDECGEVNLSFRRFDKAMGVAVATDRIAVGSADQVWSLRDQSGLASSLPPRGRHDRCFLPSESVVTGAIQGHEMAWVGSGSDQHELWVVNTLFSCLAVLDPRYSFVPRWRPPFISALAAEDRCHLNGLALRDGRPASVTVMAATDEVRGWRALPKDSGAVLDVPSGQPVTQGLVMPHSPRWRNGELFVLNSGAGALERVEVNSGHRDPVALLPGFARGLAFHRNLAFVGLSRIRETSTFGGVPLARFHDQLKCGLGVIDLATGTTVATFEFLSGVEEIFDVQVVPGARFPALAGPQEGDGVWVVPGPS